MPQVFEHVSFISVFIIFTVVMISLFALDDLLIDVLAFFKNAKPKKLTDSLLKTLDTHPEQRIAIMIANWHEHEVLERMIVGNLSQIQYRNYFFFIGVYPNDTATSELAHKLASRYPQVIAVTNSLNGPTSKGQMMNECARAILLKEQQLGFRFDIFMLHDSEDVIHPLSLKLINYFMKGADFIQIPVYSFDVPKTEFVAGTYIDEFAEHHTKEMILRSNMKQAVPSAGTGTALSRQLALTLMDQQHGSLLKEDTLTEDYHIGNAAHILGFRSLLLCYFRELPSGHRDFIATREYFPKRFRSSVRQKTRWCIGICFQGLKNLGWTGSLWHRYFLWRDRRGFLNAILISCATVILLLFLCGIWDVHTFLTNNSHLLLQLLIGFNLFNFTFRILQRMLAVKTVATTSQAFLAPLRWPLANVINVMATFCAWRDYRIAEFKGVQPKWVKTQHELPLDFGILLPASAALEQKQLFMIEHSAEQPSISKASAEEPVI